MSGAHGDWASWNRGWKSGCWEEESDLFSDCEVVVSDDDQKKIKHKKRTEANEADEIDLQPASRKRMARLGQVGAKLGASARGKTEGRVSVGV